MWEGDPPLEMYAVDLPACSLPSIPKNLIWAHKSQFNSQMTRLVLYNLAVLCLILLSEVLVCGRAAKPMAVIRVCSSWPIFDVDTHVRSTHSLNNVDDVPSNVFIPRSHSFSSTPKRKIPSKGKVPVYGSQARALCIEQALHTHTQTHTHLQIRVHITSKYSHTVLFTFIFFFRGVVKIYGKYSVWGWGSWEGVNHAVLA